MRRKAGFSLVELMITITLVGVLLGLSVPSMNRFLTKWQLQQAHRTLLSEIKLLRQRAITESRPRRMWFSTGSGYYWTQDPETFLWTPYQLPPRVTMETVIFGGGFLDTYMQPDGRALRSGVIVLRNTLSERDTLVVDLSGWAGRP